MDRYRGRSPPGRYPTPSKDTYIPSTRPARPRSRSAGAYRGRSRTPPERAPIDSYRGPRRYDPPNESYSSRPRSPRREYPPEARYDDNRGPRPRGSMHSPPPARRERVASPAREFDRPRSPPRQGYRPRSRSPRRDERVDPYAAKSWRRRSPSPRSLRHDGRPGVGSGRNSVNTSRRSSPRPVPPRASEAYSQEDYRDHRSPRTRSPPRREAPPRARSPYRESSDSYASRSRLPPGQYDAYPPEDAAYPPAEALPPQEYRQRPPPTGPSGSYRDPQLSPPSGPPSAPLSMSAHNRPSGPYAPPSGGPYPPRGGRGGYRGRGYGQDFSPRDRFAGQSGEQEAYPSRSRGRGGWNDAPYGRGGPTRDYGTPYDAGGPRRDTFGYRGRGAGMGVGVGGGGNGTSFTTPRTQRFNQHLSDVPKIKEGGEKLPPLYDTVKADKLEEEAARLRKLIDEKEIKKRQGLREWDRLETETKIASLRSDLAEEHLRSLNGEESIGTAAF